MRKIAAIIAASAFLSPLVALALTPPLTTYKDVPAGAWYESYVAQATSFSIVTGYKDANGNPTGRFGPADQVTVAQALKIGIESAGLTETRDIIVLAGQPWYQPYAAIATELNFEVMNEAQLQFDRPATRAQVAAIVSDAFNLDADMVSERYEDVDSYTPYYNHIEILSIAGVVSGDTDASGKPTGFFRPSAFINRAEAVKIAMLARQKYYGQGETGGQAALSPEVVYTGEVFNPINLTVPAGTTVTFKNESDGLLQVASDPHPAHTDYSEFDAETGMAKGKTYSFTFDEPGTYGYHNHLKPSVKGVINVR